ncbi:MAG TPA: cbb3-type cytochrome c oxidase N-terminal domain-containing protein [Phycisphaerae bacterium]|nr:cbb3-type cytochrome c oxidase N-terminal domain-containing protein [Phycisphaerae bacterium]
MKVEFPEDHPPEPPLDSPVTDHEYDGIREYDNPTPGWWVAVFVASIFFAVGYGIYYHAPVPDRSIYDRYDETVAADMKKRFAGMGELKPTEQNMLLWMQKPNYMDFGKATFKQNCVSCHGSEGQGKVGPNMTDDYYKNIRVITDIPRVITNGAANGAMPAWGNRLDPKEIALVAAYIASLRGENLPSDRPPEGEKIPPWPKLATTMPAAQH